MTFHDHVMYSPVYFVAYAIHDIRAECVPAWVPVN